MKVVLIILGMIVATAGAFLSNQSRGYFIKAAFYSESFGLSEPARKAISDRYRETSSFPSGNFDLGVPAPNSIYGTAVKRVFVATEGRVLVDFGDLPGDDFMVFKPVIGANGSALEWECFSDTVDERVLKKLQPACFKQDSASWKLQLAQAAARDFVDDDAIRAASVDTQRNPELESLYSQMIFSARNCHAMRLGTLLAEKGDLAIGELVDGAPINSHIKKPECAAVLGEFIKSRPSYQSSLQASLYGAIADCEDRVLAEMVADNALNGAHVVYRNSLLELAYSSGCVAAVKRLVRDDENSRELVEAGMVAAMSRVPPQNFVTMMGALIEAGVDPQQRGPNGQSALAEAIAKEQPVAAVLLLEAGADANGVTMNGSFPIIEASKKGYLHLTKRLLVAGAEVNSTDERGVSALLAAVAGGDLRIVDALLRAGADRYNRDENGIDAMTLAKSAQHLKIISLLSVSFASSD